MKKGFLAFMVAGAGLWLFGCRMAGGKSPYPEVSEYLENRYDQRFEVTEVSEGGSIYYTASPKEQPELEFKVFPAGAEYTNKGFDDTLPVAFTLNEAEKLGLKLERGEGEKELIAVISGYGEMETLSEQLSGISAAYNAAGLPAEFTLGTMGTGWNSADIRVEIRDFAPEGYEPEVIHIPDQRQISNSKINEAGQIRERLAEDYTAYICQYVLEDPLDYLPMEAVTDFYSEASGMTVTNGERVTEYPRLEMGKLHFAEVYRLAEAEGWEPSREENSFSITSDEGQTTRFELEFEEEEDDKGKWRARVYWSSEDTGEREPAWGDFSYEDGVIAYALLEERTGATLDAGLKLQESEERRQKNRDELNGYLNNAELNQIGSSVEIRNWAVTVNKVEAVKRIDSGSMYFVPDEGKEFIRIQMDLVNQGTESERFLSMIVTSDELMLQLATSGGLNYIPVDLMGGNDIVGTSLKPGEAKSGFLTFQVSEQLLETEEHVLLLLKAGKETKVYQIR